MLHVWFLDHPLGPYADAMIFPDKGSQWNLTRLHPMIVHFTLALCVVAVLLDVIGKALRRPQLHSAAFINLLLAGVSAVATVAAGMAAEVRLLISHDAHAMLDTHKLFGFSAASAILLLVAWRSLGRRAESGAPGMMYLCAGVLTAALSLGAGYVGSELVYTRGVAVEAIDRMALERHERLVFEEELGRRPAPAADHTGHGR
jgi:uncharacterized membrane protein